MAFTNSRNDLTADSIATLALTADTGTITDLHAEQLSLGSDSDTINKIKFGTAVAHTVLEPTGLTAPIVHNFGYTPLSASAIVLGTSVYFTYVWAMDATTITFGIRRWEDVGFTEDVSLFYLLIG